MACEIHREVFLVAPSERTYCDSGSYTGVCVFRYNACEKVMWALFVVFHREGKLCDCLHSVRLSLRAFPLSLFPQISLSSRLSVHSYSLDIIYAH